MRKYNTLLVCAVAVCSFTAPVAAQEKAATAEDQFIASSFKMAASAFASLADMEKLKTDAVNRLEATSDARYQSRYGGLLLVIGKLPVQVKSAYGIDEKMSRQQAAQKLASWDRKKLLSFIQDIPDPLIASQFNFYLQKVQQEAGTGDTLALIQRFWNKTLNLITRD